MKISFITVHVGFNFGSVLQTVATHRLLSEYADEVELVNYVPERVTYKRYFANSLVSPHKFISGILSLPRFMRNRKIYSGVLNKYCNPTKAFYYAEELKSFKFDSNIFVSGSDQLWNSKHNEGFNGIYYWDFLPAGANKVAFSSSFGVESLPEDEFEMSKKLLCEYKAISVRENSAKEIVESMGLSATHVLDPTFMLSKEDWLSYMTPRKIKESYLLVYTPYNTVDKDMIYRVARKIAKQKNLKVVTFSWLGKQDPYADQTINYASPVDFLSLMHYADFVITNSFHGTAFSINLNKQFYVLMPSSFGTRIKSVLESSALSNRLISDDLMISHEKIDYDGVNAILEKERNKARTFLKNAIGSCI